MADYIKHYSGKSGEFGNDINSIMMALDITSKAEKNIFLQDITSLNNNIEKRFPGELSNLQFPENYIVKLPTTFKGKELDYEEIGIADISEGGTVHPLIVGQMPDGVTFNDLINSNNAWFSDDDRYNPYEEMAIKDASNLTTKQFSDLKSGKSFKEIFPEEAIVKIPLTPQNGLNFFSEELGDSDGKSTDFKKYKDLAPWRERKNVDALMTFAIADSDTREILSPPNVSVAETEQEKPVQEKTATTPGETKEAGNVNDIEPNEFGKVLIDRVKNGRENGQPERSGASDKSILAYGMGLSSFGQDENPKVESYQLGLDAAGFKLARYGADGRFGDETLHATRQLQKAAGLPETGVVDSKTYAALNSKLAEKGLDMNSLAAASSIGDTTTKLDVKNVGTDEELSSAKATTGNFKTSDLGLNNNTLNMG